MTEQDALAALTAAFPDADEVTTSVKDYGFSRGLGVRFGERRHAVLVTGLGTDADVQAGIASLRKWSGRRQDQRCDSVDTAAG